MNIRYDIEKMKSIISDFANITGLSIALLDADFKRCRKSERLSELKIRHISAEC